MICSRAGLRALVAAAVLWVLSGGCASTSTTMSDRAVASVEPPAPTTSTTGAPASNVDNCTASLRPEESLPPPMQMPAGSYMADIVENGKLRVGVDQTTFYFGWRNPRTNDLEGFDIDVARLVARAIFGDDKDRIDYVVVSTGERIAAVRGTPPGQNVKVDMVASLMTMRCTRWLELSFSSEYFSAAQGILIPRSSADTIHGPADLAGRRVCATSGSTSSSNMRRLQPLVEMVEVTNRIECLVALQDGRVDAITADDTILYGFNRQDRSTRILQSRYSDEPYGLAINRAHPDFVRFVNGVLQRAREDGTLDRLAQYWAGQAGVTFPPIPHARYLD